MAQLALAWLLARGDDIIPIPGRRGSTTCARTPAPLDVTLSPETDARLDGLINTRTVSGPRYNAATLPEIDTEDV